MEGLDTCIPSNGQQGASSVLAKRNLIGSKLNLPQCTLHSKVKTLQQYRENPNNQPTPYEKAFGNSGKVKLPFARKKPQSRSRLSEEEPSATTGWNEGCI